MESPEKKVVTLGEIREKDYLSPEELAVLLGCGRTTVYALLRTGEIPSFRIGSRVRRVRRADVEEYIRHRIEST